MWIWSQLYDASIHDSNLLITPAKRKTHYLFRLVTKILYGNFSRISQPKPFSFTVSFNLWNNNNLTEVATADIIITASVVTIVSYKNNSSKYNLESGWDIPKRLLPVNKFSSHPTGITMTFSDTKGVKNQIGCQTFWLREMWYFWLIVNLPT